MPLVTTTEMFKKAYDGGYAIGAFNVNNMEIVQGITEAAGELRSPVILQVSKGARAYANHTYLVKLVEAAVQENPDIPIALHLDHGDSFELCKSCIDGGFTSVMIDMSSKPFDENVEITRQVVEYAHAHGVVVEAELGTLEGVEDEVVVEAGQASYTRPEEVEEFVTRTGCDSLAIAIGTSHGAYKFRPEQCTRNEKGILVPPPLRFDVLEEVTKRLPGFPIVLHGSSSVPQEFVEMVNTYGGNMPNAIGIPEEQLRQAARSAVCKINIDSDIRLAMTGNIRKYMAEHPDHFDPRQYLKPARQAVKDMVAHKIVNVLGSDGKELVVVVDSRDFLRQFGIGIEVDPVVGEVLRIGCHARIQIILGVIDGDRRAQRFVSVDGTGRIGTVEMEDEVIVVPLLFDLVVILTDDHLERIFVIVDVASAEPDRDPLLDELAWDEIGILQVRKSFETVQNDLYITLSVDGDVIDVFVAGIHVGHFIVVGD